MLLRVCNSSFFKSKSTHALDPDCLFQEAVVFSGTAANAWGASL
jgi:hypothetical protein